MRGIIFFTALMVIITLLWFIESAVKQYNQVNESWTKYSDTEAMIVATVLELNDQLGYGGLIHDFKNYVIRGNPKYKTLLLNDIFVVKQKLDTLEQYSNTEREQKALKVIYRVIDEYSQKIKIISKLHLSGTTIKEIDNRVKVNDQKAFDALTILYDETVKRSVKVQLETDLLMENSDKFLAKGRLLLIPIILFTLLLFYYINQMKKSSDKALKSQKWADALLDTAPEATIIVNQKGEIVRVNKMAINFFGYNHKEFLNMTVEQLMPGRFNHLHTKIRKNFFMSPSVRLMGEGKKLYTKLKDHTEVIVEINLSMTGEDFGEGLVAIASIRDITESEENKRQTEEAKNLAEAALEQLNEAKDSLVESEKMAALGELVAGMAHEINTPIGNALASSTFINDETVKVSELYKNEDLSGEELEDYLSHASDATKLIESNLARAANLINSFKRMAVDQTGGEQRSFGLDEYIREVLLSIHPVIKKTRISVSQYCDKNLTMKTYPGALSQCLSNLVMNAVIHGFSPEEEGSVMITAEYKKNCDKVQISISDNGKGIAENLHKKIFEPFYTTRRSAGGSGLGMQIVHNLISHNLGGHIFLESVEGKGTTFKLELPREFTITKTIIAHE